jgi:hypothetical protein
MIRKTKGGFKVVSHTTGRSFGEYKTEDEAKIRLRQIAYFKHKGPTKLRGK